MWVPCSQKDGGTRCDRGSGVRESAPTDRARRGAGGELPAQHLTGLRQWTSMRERESTQTPRPCGSCLPEGSVGCQQGKCAEDTPGGQRLGSGSSPRRKHCQTPGAVVGVKGSGRVQLKDPPRATRSRVSWNHAQAREHRASPGQQRCFHRGFQLFPLPSPALQPTERSVRAAGEWVGRRQGERKAGGPPFLMNPLAERGC